MFNDLFSFKGIVIALTVKSLEGAHKDCIWKCQNQTHTFKFGYLGKFTQ